MLLVLALALTLAACGGTGQTAASHFTAGFGSSTPPSDRHSIASPAPAEREPADRMRKF
jgi:hypothetical protein